ncbi:SidA/IucD/PvdA family monooxygenase [Rhizobium sp. CG5]|uniref:FAD/NAD(P)-binding protein n=1 Tax=Rhizobium sp. CG5 TaxID=2726076 RepID=UPI0020340442|nr:FAD/NAD(P)-binding protein [Rhizobium sp. CG5]MCM2474956.1 SidA/IucD/PvdA family monooxygenase [Rhizobium sp. CG5]
MLRIATPLERRLIPQASPCRVAIIGGGYTGATIARLLAIGGHCEEHDIVVFEPRGKLGSGLAYDTNDSALRLNVSAARMRAIPDEPDAFLRWLHDSGTLAADPDATAADGAIYARRSDFARFMAERMQPVIEGGLVRHVRERVETVVRSGSGWRVTGDGGTRVMADVVIIATSHPKPKAPGPIAYALNGHPRFISDPSQPNALDAIRDQDRVFVIGAGLTALDIITSLRHRGHEGKIVAFSRSGLMPQEQAAGTLGPHGDFVSKPCHTALALLRQVRRALAEAQSRGLPWQSVFDALRQQGQTIWQNLPPVEQKRFLRHLRRRYETHRYRMPPQVATIVDQGLRDGRVLMRPGRICRVERSAKTVSVDLIVKTEGVVERHDFEWVVVATGPDHASVVTRQPYLAELERSGCIQRDKHGLGIACDGDSRAIGLDGHPIETLLIAGPLARGTFGELTGVPEIAAQAEQLVAGISARLLQGLPRRRHA